MSETGQEEYRRKKLRVLKGGLDSPTVIESGNIGDYKLDHPSNREQPTDSSNITPLRRK